MITKTVTTDVEVEVEIGLEDFEDEEIADECRARAIGVPNFPGMREEMFRALQLGEDKKALELLRNYLCDVLGRVL